MPQALPIPALLGGFQQLQILAPHPSDEVLGAAGLLQFALAYGLDVQVHILTDGEMCFGRQAKAQETFLRTARRKESCLAAQLLGYALPQFWDMGDGQLTERQAELSRRIQQHHTDATLWLGPWFADGHPDHNATGQTLAALRVPALYYPVWALVDPPRLAQFQAGSSRTCLFLSDEQQRRKAEAAQLFTSQLGPGQREEEAIVQTEHLRHFVTEQEMYWYEN
ncbi:PIG-L deacetylase family protein [Comamonas sp.]